jgi:methionine synthase II (cobalamin-independent)
MTTPRPFIANGLATLIGSLPVADHREALRIIFAHTPDVPLWPQLPMNPKEGMLNQFIEGFPGVVEEGDRTYFNIHTEHFPTDQLAFFEQYLAAMESPEALNASPFAVSKERARGLYELLAVAKEQPAINALKGQITGPFTLLTGLMDENKRLGYYEPAIHEVVVKGLSLKAAWQAQFLGQLGTPAIVFIDEPALAGLGSSSFITMSLDEIRQDLTEVIEAVHQSGGLAGIHVCANTDWEFLLSLPLDILSFDAYSFFDRLTVCKEQLHAFLDRGGILAWGIVPTSEKERIDQESATSLVARWQHQAGQLVNAGWDKAALLRQALITPSCGTGSLPLPYATKVLELTRDVSASLRATYLNL